MTKYCSFARGSDYIKLCYHISRIYTMFVIILHIICKDCMTHICAHQNTHNVTHELSFFYSIKFSLLSSIFTIF